MAGHGSAYRSGYTTYNSGTEGWSKTSYNSDLECQPVLIDADGRRNPVSYGTPNGNIEYYVMRTEVVERPTYVAEYKQRTPIRVEVMRDYGAVDGKLINRPLSPEKWHKSSSPVRYHAEEKWHKTSSPVRYHAEQKWNKSSSPVRHHAEKKGNKPSSPVRYHAEEKWTKPSSPVRYHAEEKWTKPSSPVRYHAEEKWTKPSSPVRYHAEEKWTKHSSPVRYSQPMSSSPVRYHAEEKWTNRPSSPVRYHAEEKWTNRPSSPVHERPHEVENFITKVQTQASRPNKFGPLSASSWRQPPTVTTNTSGGSWTNPSHGEEWSKGKGANLSQPTNDINTAVEYLKEAVKPPSRYGGYSTIDVREAERRYGGLSVGAPPINSYGRTIDSREAERRYGGLNVDAPPISSYGRTIDSREAARKYGGTAV